MHAMAGELDIQKMGGLKKHMPVTYWTFLLASLSIAGFPGLAGFFSKDDILWRAYSGGPLGRGLYVVATLTALLTAFYSFRIIYLAFHGEFRGTHEQEHHLHESPKLMTIPLMILAIGAVVAGYVGVPPLLAGITGLRPDAFGEFLAPVVGHPKGEGTHAEEMMVMTISILAGITGIALSAFFYLRKTDLPKRLGQIFAMPYRILWNKYYVDELYDSIIVKPTFWVARSIIVGVTDGKIIEGIVNGVPNLIGRFSGRLRKLQTGMVHEYAAIMVIGAFFIIAMVLLW
jgi:NADH-quinone oxidoreductase subunit L